MGVDAIADWLDTALDRSVVLGYGWPGLWLRRRLPGWPSDPPRLDGKVVLVTGASSGLGLAACQALARLGARVLPVARNPERARDTAAQIRRAVPEAQLDALSCDVSDLRQLRALAERLAADERRLDVLINNAGVMPPQRRRTADGHELMFATHVLAPFALIAWTHELLARAAPSRVINVTSGGMYTRAIPCEDLESKRQPYSPAQIYAATKRELVVISEEWARRLRPDGIAVHVMHPGWADTAGVRRSLPRFHAATRPILRSPQQGADTIVWLAAAPEALASAVGVWQDRRPRPTRHPLGAPEEDERCRAALWRYCESIVEEAGQGLAR
jgi:dehydrogenase/reductase SDR family protein 12